MDPHVPANSRPPSRRLGTAYRQPLAHELFKLPAGWHSRHVGELFGLGGSFDHLVIGPGGVSIVFAKRHRNGLVRVHDHTIDYIGRLMPYLLHAHEEADRVAIELSDACGFPVTVRPVIAFVKTSLQVDRAPSDADVVARRDLHRVLMARRPILDPATVTSILETVAPGASTFYAA